MKKLVTIALLCALQMGCATYGAVGAETLLSYTELSKEISVVRTPLEEPVSITALKPAEQNTVRVQ